MALFANSSD